MSMKLIKLRSSILFILPEHREVLLLYSIDIRVKKSVYPSEVMLKAAYAFINDYYIHFDETETDWIIEIQPKSGGTLDNHIAALFENELIAQTVRLNVYHQTHTVRELLLARSLASTLIEKEDIMEDIVLDESDISDEALDAILTDWFEKNE